MKPYTITFLFLIIAFILMDCKGENPIDPNRIVNIEKWSFIFSKDSLSKGTAEFIEKGDGSLNTKGTSKFYYLGDTLTCTFDSSRLVVVDTLFQLTASGGAINSNSNLPPAQRYSPFTIGLYGSALNGNSSGTWTTAFTQNGWPDTLSSTFTGKKISGKGITK